MPRTLRLFAAVAMVVAVSACAGGYSKVGPGTELIGADRLHVEPTQQWNRRASTEHAELWTIDGVLLQRLYVINGVADGEPLYRVRRGVHGKRVKDAPAFRAAMGPYDVADLIDATFQQEGNSRFETLAFAPATFAGRDGFRIDLRYLDKDGLRMRGLAVGTIVAQRLYMALYVAAEEFYYQRDLPEIESIIASARLDVATAAARGD